MLISKEIFLRKIMLKFCLQAKNSKENSLHLTQKVKDNEKSMHFQENVVQLSEQFFIS